MSDKKEFDVNNQSCPDCENTMKFVREKTDDHGMIQTFLQCVDTDCSVVAVAIIRKKE